MPWTAAETTYCGLRPGAQARYKDFLENQSLIVKATALGLVLIEIIDPRADVKPIFRWVRMNELEVWLEYTGASYVGTEGTSISKA